MKNLSLLLFVAALFLSCRKDYNRDALNPQLPQLNNRDNSAGAMVDDAPWVMFMEFDRGDYSYSRTGALSLMTLPDSNYMYVTLNGLFYPNGKGGESETLLIGFRVEGRFDSLPDIVENFPREISLNGGINRGFMSTTTQIPFAQAPEFFSSEGKLYVHKMQYTNDSQITLEFEATFGFICDECPRSEVLHGRISHRLHLAHFLPLNR